MTSIQIMNTRIERDQELSPFLIFMDQIRFSGIFHSYFFHQEQFMKLFDPRIWSILLSHDSHGSTSNRYFTIKGAILLAVVVLISCINNQKMIERKKISIWWSFFPILMNSFRPRNETLEESFWSSNINRLIVSLMYLPFQKEKDFWELFHGSKESTWVLPINKKCIMNQGSQ